MGTVDYLMVANMLGMKNIVYRPIEKADLLEAVDKIM
jgi:hypothetical protein